MMPDNIIMNVFNKKKADKLEMNNQK